MGSSSDDGRIRVVALATSAFGIPLLDSLRASDRLDLLCLVSRPDRPAGRGRKPRTPPAAAHVAGWHIPVLQPGKPGRELIEALRGMQPGVLVSAAYGAYLPRSLLELAAMGVVNVHPSILPRHRGAAPVQRAILSGDDRTGVSFILTDEGWDTGPVLRCFETPIGPLETAGELERRLSAMAAERIEEILLGYRTGDLQPRPQEGEPSYAERLETSEAMIDWASDCASIERMVRAFNPRPGARTTFRGKLLKIWRSVPGPTGGGRSSGSLPGCLVRASASDGLRVQTGSGTLDLLEVQPESGTRMRPDDFLRGYRIEEGEILG